MSVGFSQGCKRAAIIYWSRTGNTEKVAQAIRDGLEYAGMEVSVMVAEEAGGINYFDYDLVCLGFPSHEWHPPKPMVDFLREKLDEHRKQGRIKPCAPVIPGKNALIFCTYSGPHTGMREAVPAGLYAGQFLEHIGFKVLDEWYILSEFHGREDASTKDRMGDIRGKPTVDDLDKVKSDARKLAERL
jgi:hypothetical protein